MNVTEHQRPGVYSVYDASSAVSGRMGGGTAAVVAVCAKGTAGKVYPLYNSRQAAEAFTDGEDITGYIRRLFSNGAAATAVR